MNKFLFILSFVFLFSCKDTKNESSESKSPVGVNTTVIAFGSCNDEEKEQPMWKYIIENQPKLWIWLGDIIYGDTDDMSEMKQQYDDLDSIDGYKNLKAICPIIGTWDDHDYGVNNGGKEWHAKEMSQNVFLDFMGAEPDDVRRKREGIYSSYTLGESGQQVKVILLDCRYFRDSSITNEKKRYIKNETGTILGEAQWKWLENELTNSTAQVHIIGSGIQVIPEEHRFEKWANFPNERRRLFELLAKAKPSNPIIISGDRHIAEISKIELKGLPKPVYEITSSGMTHSYELVEKKGEPNQHRVKNHLSGQLNFGLFFIDWEKESVEIRAEVRGLRNEILFKEDLK